MLTDFLMYVLEKGVTIRSGQKTYFISIGPSKLEKATETRRISASKRPPLIGGGQRLLLGKSELKLLPASTRRRQKPVPASDIIRVIQSRKTPMSRKEIAKRLGVTYNRLIRRMDGMVKANQLKQIGNKFAA